jgi:hypothetical protein
VAIYPVPSYQTPTLKPRPSLFGALTEFVPEEPAAPQVLLVVANTDAFTRKPIAQAVAQAFAPRVYSFVAEEVVVPEEIPNLVTVELSGTVRKPGQQKIPTLRYESHLLGALEATVEAAPEEIPDLITADASSKVREPIDRPVRTLTAASQILFRLEETETPPAEGGVVPLLIAEGVDGQTRRSPAYKKTEPRPAEVFYFYELIEEMPELVASDTNSKSRSPLKRESDKVKPPAQLFYTLEQTPPPPDGPIPDLITAGTFGNVRTPIERPQRKLRNESQLFFGLEATEAPPVDPGIVPPLVAADVDSLTRRSPAYKKVEPRPAEVLFFFESEFIPDFVSANTAGNVRRPFKQDVTKVEAPKTFIVTPDPQGDVPSLVAAGMSGKQRRAMGTPKPEDKPAGPAIFFTLLPQTPPPPDVRYPTGGMLAAQHTRRSMRRGR